ncbi:MAG: alpha/beta fold hydrolase [Candidatus Hodarchaeales archaeon]|jgi:pimeloyl-ACP methyl ester carboxylesterase
MPYYHNRESRKLYYALEGIDNRPILFLHGYLGDSKTHWGKQLSYKKILENFQVIAPDFRGYGKSRNEELEPVRLGRKWGEKHRSCDLLNDISDLVKELRLKEAPIIVGYSIGAALALEYGKRLPVSGLILLSPRPFVRKTGKSYPYLSKERRSTSKFSSFMWSILKKYLKNKSEKAIQKNLKKEKLINDFKLFDKIPILIVYGLKDTVTPQIANQVLKEHLTNAEIVEFPGDHGINHESPEEFNKTVFEFCSKIQFKNGDKIISESVSHCDESQDN